METNLTTTQKVDSVIALDEFDEPSVVASVSILDQPPANMIDSVTTMANVLKDVIEKQKMFTEIGPKKYVTIEGWATLGTMLGILPVEKEVKKLANGYEAYVNLVNKNTGVVIGGASNICTRAERTWANRDEYAVRSMAVTRATGKAYRLSFAWIMSMAGYQGTPAEEMPHDVTTTTTKTTTKTTKGFDPANHKHVDALLKELDKRSITFEQLDVVGKAMVGKSMTELDNVISKLNL